MMKAFKDYEDIKGYGRTPDLPKGGYGLCIKDAIVKTNRIGQYVQIMLDIAEGEYKGYFTEDYFNQDSEERKWHCNYLLSVPNDDGSERDTWTKRKFKTVIEAIEASNTGYKFDWDENRFKGLIIGGLFNEQEYPKSDGTIGTRVAIARLVPIDAVRNGSYKLPPDKKLKKSTEENQGFMNVSEDDMKALPFD